MEEKEENYSTPEEILARRKELFETRPKGVIKLLLDGQLIITYKGMNGES